MTNEQMIRELRAVAEKYKGKHVFTCETNINLMATDVANRIESLCDEISRQKAEIERLKEEKDNLIRTYAECQAEAVKEFAERLKAEMIKSRYSLNVSPYARACNAVVDFWVDEIDNLVKEFTEGQT